MTAVLGGALFVAYGYIDRPNVSDDLSAVIDVLAVIVYALFPVALCGLPILWSSQQLGVVGWVGIAFAVYGSGGAVVVAILGYDPMWAYFLSRWGWAPYLHEWLSFMFIGLNLIGIATVRAEPFRGIGALVLVMGVFGWVYRLTDTGALFESRLVHVGFGMLFSLGWIALGTILFGTGVRRARRLRQESKPLGPLLGKRDQ